MTPHERCYTTYATTALRWIDVAAQVLGSTRAADVERTRRYAALHASAAGLPWPIVREPESKPVRRSRVPWTRPTLATLRKHYAAGTHIDEIAIRMGRSRRSITAAAERYDIPHAGRHTGDKGRAYWIEHEVDGRSWRAIARRHHISPTAARSTARSWASRRRPSELAKMKEAA